MTNFVSIVRFKVKPEHEGNFVEKIKEFSLPKGALSHTGIKTGDRSYCTVVIWEEKQDLANARPEMISFLDTARHLLEEISPELGVTDPVSGPVIHSINQS